MKPRMGEKPTQQQFQVTKLAWSQIPRGHSRECDLSSVARSEVDQFTPVGRNKITGGSGHIGEPPRFLLIMNSVPAGILPG
jgi:hypothetical protein